MGPQEVQDPQFLLQLAMTHYILGSICFRTPPDPPIWLETQKCAIFGPFWSFHLKSNPKVGVHRVKFNIGNFAQLFFGGFYICWDYVISFLQHFPMRKFSLDIRTKTAIGSQNEKSKDLLMNKLKPEPHFKGIWIKVAEIYF